VLRVSISFHNWKARKTALRILADQTLLSRLISRDNPDFPVSILCLHEFDGLTVKNSITFYAVFVKSWLPIKDVFRTLDWDRIKEELGSIGNLMQLADGFN